MATTMNKQRIVNQLLGAEALASDAQGEELAVFEQFVYALCRENATPEQAELAYRNLRTKFFDWNEVRVSTIRELEEAMAGLGDAEGRAQRLVSFLQEVFEEKFAFELDGVQKKGVKQGVRSLTRYGAANDYVLAWVVQRSLGGHAVPVDAATQRAARRLGLIDPQAAEDPEAARTALEHLVPKAKAAAFTDAVSNLAEQFCWEGEPNCQQCPMQGECLTGQELLGEQLASVRTARAKSR